MNTKRVSYNFRYFLPYPSQWGSYEFCIRRLEELLNFCGRCDIRAVQFYVNTKPGTYYMPPVTAAEQMQWAKWMKEEVAAVVRDAGISYQLNFQMILGASSWGLDMRDEYSWGFLVNQYGVETLGCACPLDPVFREEMGKMLRLWASTRPDIMWIDDDFRMHNHGLNSDDLDYYCFCDRHISDFSKFVGCDITRQDLVSKVLKPGRPDSLRNKWLDFLGRTMVESSRWINNEVSNVSSDTRLALMTSQQDVHSAEGRDWKNMLSALSGGYKPLTRPCCGVYTGTNIPPKYNVSTYRSFAQSIETLEDIFVAGNVEFAPELENTRFTTWCKSKSNTRFVLTLGQLVGCREITLSICDLDGSPLNDEPTNEILLKESRKQLEAIADLELGKWHKQGLVFINAPDAAKKQRLSKNAKWQDLGLNRKWEDILLSSAVPAYYLNPQKAACCEDVVVLEKYTAWCLSDEQMLKILSRAVLLDGEALEVIQQRGLGKYCGAEVGRRRVDGTHSEQYKDGFAADVIERRTPHRSADWYEMLIKDAELVSEFIDGKNCFYPGSCIYENELGGRVAVNASVGDFAYGTFGNHARLRWLHAILRWLSRDRFTVLARIPHHCLCIARSSGNESLIALANLGTDELDSISYRLPETNIAEVLTLSEEGNWVNQDFTVADDIIDITCRNSLRPFEWFIIRFSILGDKRFLSGKT